MPKLTYHDLSIILKNAQSGDMSAFEEFYAATYNAQYFKAKSILRNDALCDEAMQEAYVKFYNAMSTIKDTTKAVSFLSQIVHNCCLDIIGKEKLNSKVDIDDYALLIKDKALNPEEKIMAKSEKDMVYLALSQMETSLRDVLIKRYIDELSMSQIAADMNISLRTAHRYLKKGATQMKNIFEKLKNSTMSFVLFTSPFVSKIMKNARDSHSSETVKSTYNTVLNGIGATGVTASSAFIGKTIIESSTSLTTKVLIAGAIGTTAVVGGVGVYNAVASNPPQIEIIDSNTDQYTNQMTSITYGSTGKVPLMLINAYRSDGTLYYSSDKEHSFEMLFGANDTYTLEFIGDNGDSFKQDITITNIDHDSPFVEYVGEDESGVAVKITDSQSGNDYNSLVITNNEDGSPIEYWVAGDIIHYSSEYTNAHIAISDNLNNVFYTDIVYQ